MICSADHFLNQVCYEIGIKELIRDGYLSPLISKAGVNRADSVVFISVPASSSAKKSNHWSTTMPSCPPRVPRSSN